MTELILLSHQDRETCIKDVVENGIIQLASYFNGADPRQIYVMSSPTDSHELYFGAKTSKDSWSAVQEVLLSASRFRDSSHAKSVIEESEREWRHKEYNHPDRNQRMEHSWQVLNIPSELVQKHYGPQPDHKYPLGIVAQSSFIPLKKNERELISTIAQAGFADIAYRRAAAIAAARNC